MLHTGGRGPVPGTSASGTVPTKPFMESSKSWRSLKGRFFAISALALRVAGSGPLAAIWANAGVQAARKATTNVLRSNIGGTQEVDEQGDGFVWILFVDPVRTALEGRGLEVMLSGSSKLALQRVAGGALASDRQSRHLGEPRSVRLGEELGVAVECLVGHEGRAQAAFKLQRRDIACDIVGHEPAGLGTRVHEGEDQRFLPALPFGDGLVDSGEAGEVLGARIGRSEAREFGGASQALDEGFRHGEAEQALGALD